MIEMIRELIKYREVLYMIAWRDIRVKYKQSIMGFMWAILMPLIIVSAGILVKYALAVVSKKPLEFADIITVSVKSLPWAFFVSTVRFSANSLISNSGLVTKIYFPRVIFPMAAVISQIVDFIVAGSLLVVMLSIAQIGATVYLLWVPVLICVLIVFASAVGILLSAANLFFRDVKYLVEVILTFAIFFTPVFYEVTMFGKWGKVLLLNPVAPILEGFNDCIVYHQMPRVDWLLYSVLVASIGIWFSMKVFGKLEPKFAESI